MRRGVDVAIVRLAAMNGGVVTTAQLRTEGVGRTSIARRVETRFLTRIHKGVYAVAPMVGSDTPLRAALLAAPDAVASHRSAGVVHGWPVTAARPEILVGKGANHDLAGVIVHETRYLPAIDTATVGEVRVTSPARSLCDLASVTSPGHLRHLVETALVRRVPAPPELVACHRSLARRGRRGVVVMRDLLVELLDDEPFPLSRLELELTLALDRRGLGDVRRQFVPPWFDGISGVVDFAAPRSRLIIEADGRAWHTIDQDRARDAERDRRAAKHGWVVLRVGWHEVVHRTESVLDDLVEIVAARSPAA